MKEDAHSLKGKEDRHSLKSSEGYIIKRQRDILTRDNNEEKERNHLNKICNFINQVKDGECSAIMSCLIGTFFILS